MVQSLFSASWYRVAGLKPRLELVSAQAAGLWQFIPSTGKIYGLKQNWWYDGRRDIHASTQAALDYLREGDVFVVTKIDRLARSMRDLLEIVERVRA